jgi:hypothetical protein
MAKKNKKQCADCAFFDNGECVHIENIGIEIRYRKETSFFINKPEEINKDGDCENWQG